LSSFTHPQVVANLYEFLSSAEHKGRYFEEQWEPNSCSAPLTFIAEKIKSMVLKFQSFFKISMKFSCHFCIICKALKAAPDIATS